MKERVKTPVAAAVVVCSLFVVSPIMLGGFAFGSDFMIQFF